MKDSSESTEIAANRKPSPSKTTKEDFTAYLKEILGSKPDRTTAQSLLLPTETDFAPLAPLPEQMRSTREFVNAAVLRGNASTSPKRVATRFEIQKEGSRVAIITLARSSYKLGDIVSASINFSDATIASYSLHATLESFECVDPSVALRSISSMQRTTRQIHASLVATTAFAHTTGFRPLIPAGSTPTFSTSAIENKWNLRFEFVICGASEDDGGREAGIVDLLEEVSHDDRATLSAAIQTLRCEIIDVRIPLTVYGATQASDERPRSGDMPI